MNNKVFGNVEFNMGWETKIEISIWATTFQIIVSAESYYEVDQITEAQEDAYTSFLENKDSWIKKIENILTDCSANASKRFIPALLKIAQDGSTAMVFDDTDDVEGGIVVCLTPTFEVKPIDQYL